MSSSAKAEADICCANCGITEEVDEVKLLEECACKFLRSCSDNCREEHREQHKCVKRAQELHDDDLFTQPDGSHLGECTICFLPMPLDSNRFSFYSCCSKLVCNGCVLADLLRNGGGRCLFCREPVEEFVSKKRMMKRIKANDPAAMRNMGALCRTEGDYNTAFEYLTKAAKLGDVDAHYQLANMYHEGESVEKDEEKEVYHYEQAAIGGHPNARYNLGSYEERNGNIERAVKHYIIGANHGFEKSMKVLWKHYSKGNITKEDLESTLRTHKAALDEMKSPEREAAEAWRKAYFTLREE